MSSSGLISGNEAFIIETMHEGFLVVDQEGNILKANQAAGKLTGFSSEELISMPYFKLDSRLDNASNDFVQRINQLKDQPWVKINGKKNNTVYLEIRVRKPDEAQHLFYIFLQQNGSNEASESPKSKESVGVWNSDLKMLSNNLQLNTEVFGLFLEHTPASIAIFDREMRYLAVSKRLLDDYELEEKNIIGRSHYDIFPEIPERWRKIHRDCLAGASASAKSDPFPRKNGKLDWIRWEIIPWKNKSGAIGGIMLFSEVITEAQNALAEAKTLATRMKLAADAASFGIWEYNLKDNSLIWDDGMYALYDVNDGTFGNEYNDWQNALHPDDRENAVKETDRAIEGKIKYDTSFRIITKKGNHKFIKAQGLVIRDENGYPEKMIGINYDITKQKTTEKKLKDSENRFKKIAKSTPGAICTFKLKPDNSLSFSYISPSASDVLGIHPRELTSNRNELFHLISDPKTRKKIETGILKSAVKLKLWNAEFAINHPKKGTRWIDARFKPQANAPGEVVWYGIFRDMTDQKNMIRQVIEQEEKFNKAFNNAPDAITLVRIPEGILVDANTAFLKLAGKSKEEIIEKPALDLDLWKTDEVMRYEAALKEKGVIKEFETIFHTPDGNKLDMMVSGELFEMEGSKHIISTFTDITTLKNAQDKLTQLNAVLESRVKERTAQLENVNRDLRNFTYSVSHDLKAPLRGIDGYSRLLQELYIDDLNEEAQFFVNTIRSSTKQMNQLIEDLLQYSRLERSQVHKQAVDIQNQIESVLNLYQSELTEHGFKIEMSCETQTIEADYNGLQIALRNLIENAIKFSKEVENPRLQFLVEDNRHHWNIIVADNGIGFNMKYHNKIFEIFQRLHRAEDYPGTGIGLAMVAKAVSKMNGEIRAESVPGEGTKFYLVIPK